MIRGTPGMRLALAVLSPTFLLVWLAAIRSEERPPWASVQEEFAREYARRAAAKLDEAESRGDAAAAARWRRVADEVARSPLRIEQTWIEELRIADRCATCHRGAATPLFADAAEPFRTHPGALLRWHDPSVFGCTPCHGGDGAATTADDAHRGKPGAVEPMLPVEYVQSRCAACHEVTHGLEGAEVVTRGADLFLAKGCYGCHAVEGLGELPKFGPPLASLGSKLREPARWIHAWVKDPPSLAHDTLMPSFGLDGEEVAKVTAFLASLPAGRSYPAVGLEGASADEGERLFAERGCRGCHGVEPDEAGASPRVPNLSAIGSKATAGWLDAWIADPRAVAPGTPMPRVELTDVERRSIVAYLLTLEREEPLPPAPDLARFVPDEGKELVRRYECFGCHEIPGFEDVRPSVPDLGEFARKHLDDLDFGSRREIPRTKWAWLDLKLREPRAYESEKIRLRMPHVALADDERRAIVAVSLAFGRPPLPERFVVRASPEARAIRRLAFLTERFHCGGCHRLGGKDAHLARLVERRNLLPPTLDGIGARLQGQYLYEFLNEPKKVRPWLALRMPAFGFTEAESHALAAGFAAAGGAASPWTYVVEARIPRERFERGIRRFRHYKCVQCHPTSIEGGLPPDLDPEDLSIDLTLARTRLRPEWLREFLARPKQIAGTQTRMPTVFYTVDGAPKVDRPVEDIADIATYLMGMTEPPEATLAVLEEARKVEEEKVVDWMKLEY